MSRFKLTLLFVSLALLWACVPTTDSTSLCGSEDISASLTQLHDDAMPAVSDEIEALDSQIDKYDDKMQALIEIRDDIASEILHWNYSIQEEGSPSGERLVWYVEYKEEDCAVLENEYYQMVEFKLNWQWAGEKWEIYSEQVQIQDKESSASYNHTLLDTVMDNLQKGRSRLITERAAKSNAKEKSIQVLNDALNNEDVWEIEEVMGKVYSVNGYGLGYGEDLATGNWYYYQDTGYIEPRDTASVKLMEILTASLLEPATEAPSPEPSLPSENLY